MTALLLSALLAAGPATVRIEARDFTLSLPARVPGGRIAFTLDNRGTEPHSVRFLRLADRHTFDDFLAWQKSGAAIPAWLVPSGGIGAVAPAMTSDYIATLTAGSYVVLCASPSIDGTPHVAKGMAAPLRIDDGGAGVAVPEADLTVVLSDHHFLLSAPVPGGRPIWHLRNEGSEPHQALVVRLPDEVNQFQEKAWFDHGSRGARPGIPVGGAIDLPAGGEAWFSMELTPGKYLLLCAAVEEEGAHYALGMSYAFVIE